MRCEVKSDRCVQSRTTRKTEKNEGCEGLCCVNANKRRTQYVPTTERERKRDERRERGKGLLDVRAKRKRTLSFIPIVIVSPRGWGRSGQEKSEFVCPLNALTR